VSYSTACLAEPCQHAKSDLTLRIGAMFDDRVSTVCGLEKHVGQVRDCLAQIDRDDRALHDVASLEQLQVQTRIINNESIVLTAIVIDEYHFINFVTR